MTEAMPFLQKCDITFLRPPPILPGGFVILNLKCRAAVPSGPFFIPFQAETFVSSSLQFIPALSSAFQDANCSSSSPQVRKR